MADQVYYTGNIIPIMTGNTAPSGIADGSAYAGNKPYMAFDGTDGSIFQSDTIPDAWISYTFPTPRSVKGIGVSLTGTKIKDFRVEGLDGGSWVTLASYSITSWASGLNILMFPNTESYSTYRLYVTSNNVGTAVFQIYTLEFYEIDPKTPELFVDQSDHHVLKKTNAEIDLSINNASSGNASTDLIPITNSSVIGSGKQYRLVLDMTKYVSINNIYTSE